MKVMHKRLLEVLAYEPITGVFRWRVKIAKNTLVGSIAGTMNDIGYRQIRIDGTIYCEHQLAWFYMTERWAERLDHKNRIRSDNRLENLREATHSQNLHNTKAPKNNTSGMKGVSKSKRKRNPFCARICVNERHINLGNFPTKEEAYQAYVQASQKYLGEFACELP